MALTILPNLHHVLRLYLELFAERGNTIMLKVHAGTSSKAW
ncbi:hypothetical protein WKI72_02460 [Candidatus Erwinia dacicola]